MVDDLLLWTDKNQGCFVLLNLIFETDING